ncbi:hypothetical protein [Halorarius halobius]|uniref:hypothetical protein n=1 Tax=Halorarius halobius TaxID=2962671 RepID=UPI0020CFCFCF|nr:hypothetical protein [Halorarius halobius]
MSISTKPPFTWLEPWRSTLFLLAGGLFVVFAGFWAVFAFTETSSEVVQDVVGPAGWALSFAGLLGLYPALSDGSPRLADATAVFAALGFVGATITTAGNLLPLVGVAGEPPASLAPLQLLLLLGIVLGFLTAGGTCLKTSTWSRRVGVLLLAPAGVFVVNMVRVATLGSTTPTWAPFVLGGGQALALLAIGYTLRAEASPADGESPPADITVQ